MADSQSLPLEDRTKQIDPNIDIVVSEPAHYPWPDGLESEPFGQPIKRIRYYFEPFMKVIKAVKRNYSWHTFYQNQDTGSNFIESYPEVLVQLERLFERELGTKYSPEQYQLLVQSQIVVVAVAKDTNSIAGYFSSSYAGKNTILGVDFPITFGNHGVISQDHQQFKIGVTMGAITTLHGQKLRDLFKTIACVLRTNNKHIMNPLKQAGNVYRSDKLAGNNLSPIEIQARSAIQHMHDNLFQLPDVQLPFDKPLNIEHRFDPAFTIDGVRSDQIIYICCVTSLSRCIYKLFARRQRRQQK